METIFNLSECPELVEHFKELYPVEQWKAEGFFEDDDLLSISCHWLGFNPPRPSLHFLLAVIYIIVFLIGLLSNSLVIYVITRSSARLLLNSVNILLANLAISDLIIVLMIPIFIFNSLHQGPAIGGLGCTIYGFLTGLSGTCSIMSIAAIALQRYLTMSQPSNNVDGKPTRRWAFLMALSGWIYSAVFASLPFVGVGKYVPEGLLTSCSFDYMSNDIRSRIFILVFFIGAWIVPLSIIVYCYSSIVRAVFHVRHDVVEGVANTHGVGNRMVPVAIPFDPPNSTGAAAHAATAIISQPNAELKVSKLVLSLIATWIIAWTPYAVVTLIGILGYGHLLTPMGALIPALFAKLATCVDPFIYALNQKKIRIETFRRLNLVPHVDPSAGATPYYQYPGLSVRPLSNNNINNHQTIGTSQRQTSAIASRNLSSPVFSVVGGDRSETVNITSCIHDSSIRLNIEGRIPETVPCFELDDVLGLASASQLINLTNINNIDGVYQETSV